MQEVAQIAQRLWIARESTRAIVYDSNVPVVAAPIKAIGKSYKISHSILNDWKIGRMINSVFERIVG